MKLIDLLEDELIDIKPKDIKVENGIMLPNQFPDVVGEFDCRGLKITSLINHPKEIHESFYCGDTDITSLEFIPKDYIRSFDCFNAKITSLEYAPLKCFYFNCGENNITHLKGIGRSYLKECERLFLPMTSNSVPSGNRYVVLLGSVSTQKNPCQP